MQQSRTRVQEKRDAKTKKKERSPIFKMAFLLPLIPYAHIVFVLLISLLQTKLANKKLEDPVLVVHIRSRQ